MRLLVPPVKAECVLGMSMSTRPTTTPTTTPCSFKVVALVCKRFSQLCLAPELLRCVQLAAVGERAVPRCRSLLAFLQTHARHVRRLTLHACISEARPQEAAEEELGDPALRQELREVLQQCYAALGAAGAAEEVILSAATPVADAAWLASLATLRLLWVGTDEAVLELPAGLSRLQLAEAGLRGSTVRLADPSLPPSLTRLHLAGSGAADMLPEQVGQGVSQWRTCQQTSRCLQPGSMHMVVRHRPCSVDHRLADSHIHSVPVQLPLLPGLAALELLDTDLPGASLRGLAALTSLRALQLDGQSELPPCLPTLKQLRQLVSPRGGEAASAAAGVVGLARPKGHPSPILPAAAPLCHTPCSTHPGRCLDCSTAGAAQHSGAGRRRDGDCDCGAYLAHRPDHPRFWLLPAAVAAGRGDRDQSPAPPALLHPDGAARARGPPRAHQGCPTPLAGRHPLGGPAV